MKHVILTGLIVLAFIAGFTSVSSAETITIVADVWCPYNCKPDSNLPGYGIEIAKQVFEKAGYKIEYKNIPWARAIKMSREGKYNAIIGAYKEDAPDFIFPQEEFGFSKNTVFVLKDNSWKYKGPASLKNLRIGLIKDYSYGEDMDNYFQDKKSPIVVDYVGGDNPLELNINKLIKKRIDLFIEDPNVCALIARRMNTTDKIVSAGDLGTGDNLYIAFSPTIKKSKEFAQILSQGIKKLRQSGELEKILQKYGLKDWR